MIERHWWHPVAEATALGAAPLGVLLLSEAIVLWRDAQGAPRAFADRCPHRGTRLSLGRVCEGRLECAYHGWQFGPDGACLHVPAVPQFVPPVSHHAGVHAALDAYGLIWVRLAATGLKTGAGFHKPGTTGTFGATAAAKILGLDRQQTLMAFGLAGSRAGSLSINTGSMTKSSHAGHAARMGVECGVLAQMGWTASADVFGPQGFFDTFLHGDAQPDLLTRGFGDPYRMIKPGVGFKKHPSNYFTHRPIDAALALREEHKLDPKQIERVEIVFPRFDYVNRPQPISGLDGKFSVQYATAIALIDGEVTVDSFTNERRYAADVVALLPKVQLRIDDAIPVDFDTMHAIVNVWAADGKQLSKRIEKLSGWVGNPLTREQRLKKFFSCSRRVLDEAAANRVLELVEKLESLPDVGEIMDLVRCERSAR